MREETKTLILYRLERAYEPLEEAAILLEKGYANTFVNRLYYGCFYAISALLLTKDLSSAKHSGVRSLFHKNFVKTGVVSTDIGKIYDKLYRNRQKGDYADLVRFQVDAVSDWYDEARKFVKDVEKNIRRALDRSYIRVTGE